MGRRSQSRSPSGSSSSRSGKARESAPALSNARRQIPNRRSREVQHQVTGESQVHGIPWTASRSRWG